MFFNEYIRSTNNQRKYQYLIGIKPPENNKYNCKNNNAGIFDLKVPKLPYFTFHIIFHPCFWWSISQTPFAKFLFSFFERTTLKVNSTLSQRNCEPLKCIYKLQNHVIFSLWIKEYSLQEQAFRDHLGMYGFHVEGRKSEGPFFSSPMSFGRDASERLASLISHIKI